MDSCQSKCSAQGHKLMGCIWLADIKTDWKSRFLGFPMSGGGRLAITHCCCDYPEVKDTEQRRKKWENGRRAFRKRWSKELGDWPVDEDDEYWPGHHVQDLGHGGDPLADNNVLPAPSDVHAVFTKEYPQCYAGGGRWSTVGPDRPYYLHCNGAELFERRPETLYWLLPLSKIVCARVAILREDSDTSGPASWYVVCNVQDGNYAMLDVGTKSNGRYPVLDGWHESFPKPERCKRIAGSFSEFLERALQSGDSLYWLKDEGESPR